MTPRQGLSFTLHFWVAIVAVAFHSDNSENPQFVEARVTCRPTARALGASVSTIVRCLVRAGEDTRWRRGREIGPKKRALRSNKGSDIRSRGEALATCRYETWILH